MRTWLTGVLSGLLYGVLFALAARYLIAHTWTSALIAGAATGVPFGVAMVIMRRRADRFLAALPGDLTREQRRAALRSSRGGPVPDDPAVRAAALDSAVRQLERYKARWFRALLIVVPALLLLSAVLILLDRDHAWWTASPQLAGVAVLVLLALEPRRLRRRIAVLR
ncbi:hypothetical protein [Kribbella sp. NPDC055071]